MSTVNESVNAYRAGSSAYTSGNYTKAAIAFRWASGLDPSNPVFSHAAALSAAKAGDGASAEWLFVRAISGTKRQLGARHPFMLLVARDLAAYYRRKGRAEDMAKLASRIVARANPPAVARSGDKTLQALADLCGMAGRLSAAIPFYQSALDSRREQYGDGHPKTAACIAGLAEIHRKLGDAGKARQMFAKARLVRKAVSSVDAVA